MRKDHYSPPVKWTREFRQALKLGDAHFKIYAYLEGGPESHATGLYFVTPATIAEMVREDRDTVVRVMDDLERVGLMLWDSTADVVLVHVVCAEQYRGSLCRNKDNRIVEARRHLAALPKTHLRDLFLGRWPIFREPTEGPCQGATEGACEGPYQAPTEAPTPTPRSFSPPPIPTHRPDVRTQDDNKPANATDWRRRAKLGGAL
jgi:hypothetical protein